MNSVDAEDLEQLLDHLSRSSISWVSRSVIETLVLVLNDTAAEEGFDQDRYSRAFAELHATVSGVMGVIRPMAPDAAENMSGSPCDLEENFIPKAQAVQQIETALDRLRKVLGLKQSSRQQGGSQ